MIRFELDHPTLRLGVVRADILRVGPSDERLLSAMTAAEAALRVNPAGFSEPTRAAIRDVLRRGGYKPTGRGKPASEFLFGAATSEAGMPRVNNLVDINNLASLESAHPISIFDAALLGDDITLRFGGEGESYVFNASGQTMDVKGLPVICRGAAREPVGNAVKDSMLCKVHPGTRRVLVAAYGTRALPERALELVCERLGELLEAHAGGTLIEHAVL
ncbi:MAG: phenylalanine--tRNA ligase beta subunit-related protein [Myxococcales bacterium]